MKVTAFIGSARKKHTYNSTEMFLQKLQRYGNIEYELIVLSDYKIEPCRGCKQCFDKGESSCPLKDDRNKLLEKIDHSDAVIFASPNYSFHVSGIMKVFLDRISFIFHRPRYFGKTSTSIVAQGIYGGEKIVKYFNFIGKALGFNVVKGSCIKTLEPMTEKAKIKIEKKIEKHSKRFYAKLIKKELPTPSLFDIIIFRLSRTSIKTKLNENYRDYNYYKEMGWFESDFFYSTKLNPLKKITGKLIDAIA
jgi:multimeric flavodoxin WrbA